MRLSWFTTLRAGRRPRGKRQQLKAAPLRVRQLERRRVLDAAVSSVMVSTVLVADVGETEPAATTTNATDAPPIVAPVENNSNDTAHTASLSPAQGLAANTPPVLVATTNQEVNEGQTLNLSATGGAPPLALYIDPDLADSHTATVDWGDGSPVQNATIIAGVGAGAIGGTHVYADDGNYTVTVSVADNNGGSASQAFNVLVKNVPPVLVTATDQMVNEGQQLDLSASGGAPPLVLFVDPGLLDTHTATVNWGDGSPTENATVIEAMGAGALGGAHTYADNGIYTVTVTVTDDDGGTSTGTFEVTVKNVAPFVDLTGPTGVNEGSANNWNLGSVVDPGTDTVTQYIIHWGDGNTDTFTAAQIAGMGNTIGHTYADGPNSYTIAVDLVDEDGTFSSVDTLNVTVNNVPPFVDLTGPTSVNEGSANSWNLGAIVDPGLDTVTQYIIHWGDGNTDTFTATEIAGMSGAVGHTYADGPNSYMIAVDLVDEDGTHLAVDTLAVAVNNVPPVVDLTGPTSVNEGSPNTWMLGAVVDPGSDTVSQYVIHWGDGNTDTFTAAQIADMGNSIGHTYIEGPNSYTISVDLVDEDGTFLAVYTLSVTVDNVAPSVALNAVPDIFENGVATLTGSYTDIGVEDAHTVTVNWADANDSAPSTFTVAAIQDSTGSPTLNVGDTFSSSTDGAILTITSINAATGQVGFSVQHQYLDDGPAPGNNTNSDPSIIGVTVVDDDGSSGSGTTTVTVQNATPSVALNSAADISENGVATVTGSYTDIGLLDAHVVTVNWDDPNNGLASTFAVSAIRNAVGTATLNVGDTFSSSTDDAVLTITSIDAATGHVGFSVQHQYLDDGLSPGNNTISDTSTIGVTVADDDADSGSGTALVTVHNVTPSVALNSVIDISENGVATLTGSYTDIGLLDAHTVTINWDDPNNGLASTFTVSAIQNAAGAPTLSVGAAFNSSTDSAVLTITSINATTGQVGFSVQHQYLDDGLALGNNTISDTSTIGVTVADDDTQSGSSTATVTVHNVTPSVALNSVPDINENGVATLTGSYTDIGLLDAHTLTIHWADPNNSLDSTFAISAIRNAAGTATLSVGDTFTSSTDSAVLTITAIDAATGQVSFSVQHQYLDDGLAPGNGTTSDTSTIGVTVVDDDTQTGSNTTTVTVHNVAPAYLDVVGDSIDEGHVATISLNVVDLGTLDVFTFTVDWRDGSTATIGGLGAANASGTVGATNFTWTAATRQLMLSHLYPDNANYEVVVRMADDDMAGNFAGAPSAGNYIQQTTQVAVANLAPTLAGTTNLMVDEGSAVTLASLGVHISDLGFDNPSNQTPPPLGNLTTEEFAAFSIDWGDGFTTTSVSVVGRVSGSAIDSTTANPTTAQFMHDAHHYADDGVYIVTVRMADDNMGAFSDPALFATGVAGVDYVDRQFQVLVKNVTPTLGVTSITSQQQTGATAVTTGSVTRGTTITINESGTVSFAAGFTDPGFSLDSNPANPADTSFPRNEIFRYYISWGDNRETVGEISAADVASLVNGGPAVLTSGAFDTSGMIHTYADDGTYTVTIRVADDNMGAFADTSRFANGVRADFGTNNGGDFVETTFTVVVNNIAPSFVPQPGGANILGTDVSSEGRTTINVAFSDPGFDNTANLNGPAPPTITDTLHETFTHVIDWGDGTVDAVHTYADSGSHDVTITQIGPDGTQTFTVAGIGGANVLTLVSSQDINNPSAVVQPFTYVVDWGDGNVQTITLMLEAPGAPTVNGQTAIGTLVRTSGNVGIPTTGSFGITHQYLGPPDPLNPTNDIRITVSIVDDNNDSSGIAFVEISNPGINTFNVAIDTTPDVPRLALAAQPPPLVLLDQQSAAPSSLQASVPRIARSELTTTSDRYLELVVVSPDGNEIERYRLSDEALVDLRGLFATLPDNRYKIFLIRTDNNSKRLVMDVFVRRGRVIDPSDDSEGTRDRPPTAEGTQQNKAEQKNVPQNNAQPIGAPQQPAGPLQNNPLLERVPEEQRGAANERGLPAIGRGEGAAPSLGEKLSHKQPTRSRVSMRWALPLAGLGLVASRESWSQRLGVALETADDGAWQRLRRAGRLGKSGRKSPTGVEMQSATTDNPV